jgi:hypothetical protein
MPIPYRRRHARSARKHSEWLTVCGGGTLECPPGVETDTLTSIYPFSAMPGIAMMEPSMSPYMPAKLIR